MLGCLAVIMTAVIATGCSKEQRQELINDTVEVAARNIAKEGGEERFADEGIKVPTDSTARPPPTSTQARCPSTAPGHRPTVQRSH